MQIAKTEFFGAYENQKTAHKKNHILNKLNKSYCGKNLNPNNLKDGKYLFGKRFFKNNKWNNKIVCSICLKKYINVGFTDIKEID